MSYQRPSSPDFPAFAPGFPAPPGWFVKGQGDISLAGDRLHMRMDPTTAANVADIQLNDHGYERHFRWRPPVTLTVRARFSHDQDQLLGTAGFGFWNKPFKFRSRRFFNLPRAIWFFFASSQSNMKLALEAPGCGMKAATMDIKRGPFLALLPTLPLAVPLMNIPALYRRLWPAGQRVLGVHEAFIPLNLTEWHTYVLDWQPIRSRFLVDGQLLYETATSPRGPLGFVMWLDNKYAVLTPWGRVAYSKLAVPDAQWLEVDELTISK